MMSARTLRQRVVAALGLVLTVSCLIAADIASRNYDAAADMLATAPKSTLIGHPELTGVANLEEVTFRAADGTRIAGWYAPSMNRGAVVITHGTNADRSSMLPEVRVLSAAGYGVLAFDWPGLGDSGGHILWGADAGQALVAALDWLSRRPDVDPRRIGGLGFSMGGFIMARVAATDLRLRALVLEGTPSSFDDYLRVHNRHWGLLSEWPARWALRHSGLLHPALDPERLLSAIAPRPILLIGGTADGEIPELLVRKNYEAAGAPKELWIVPNADHGNYVAVAPSEYPRQLIDFFAAELLRANSDLPSRPK